MKILVIGGGGREHAIIKSLKKSPLADEIYALPGNGGIAQDAKPVDIDPLDLEAVRDFAVENKIDFAVVAPDDPLVLGLADVLRACNIKTFGPSKAAAIIEGSKSFSKDLMKKYNIPTADFQVFDSYEGALEYVKGASLPLVIKADGLALGKGVIIAETLQEAISALEKIMVEKAFGKSGSRVVIEEFLTGPEVSVLAFTDGKTIKPMVSSMDHKRALDGDKGLNTGGMGTVAPNPYYTKEIEEECMRTIFLPTISAMNMENRTFKGCLYFGLMLTDKGPKVIEYNCRFGDPETQVVLPLLEGDLLEIFMAVEDERLADVDVSFKNERAVCVILAAEGYPKSYEKGNEIDISKCKQQVFVAGAKLNEDGRLVTNGGRVLGVTATGKTLKEAIALAYEGAEQVVFKDKYMRSDIGQRALKGESNGL